VHLLETNEGKPSPDRSADAQGGYALCGVDGRDHRIERWSRRQTHNENNEKEYIMVNTSNRSRSGSSRNAARRSSTSRRGSSQRGGSRQRRSSGANRRRSSRAR
jgi:hypothetical protein